MESIAKKLFKTYLKKPEQIALATGYYLFGVNKDRNKVNRYTPGGGRNWCVVMRESGNTIFWMEK